LKSKIKVLPAKLMLSNFVSEYELLGIVFFKMAFAKACSKSISLIKNV
jgi:hypothetical protein